MGVTSQQRSSFFSWATAALAVVVIAGFTRTFFLKPLFPEVQAYAAPEPFFIVHGIASFAWMLLLMLQANLARTARIKLHRTLGAAGAGLAVLVLVLGIYGALLAAGRPGGFIGVPLPPGRFLIFPLTDMLLFAGFVGAAIAWRRDADTHKRLMYLGTVNLVEAAIIRLPIGFIAAGAPFSSRLLSYLFIIALIVFDYRSQGRLHRVTLIGALVIVLSLPLRMALMETGAWDAMASLLLRLVA